MSKELPQLNSVITDKNKIELLHAKLVNIALEWNLERRKATPDRNKLNECEENWEKLSLEVHSLEVREGNKLNQSF